MICNICNKQIIDVLRHEPGSVNRDCHFHLYSTFHNDKIISYVVYWKSTKGIEYKIQSSSAPSKITDIFSIERISESYNFSSFEEIETHLFSSDTFFELPIIDDLPRPDLLIPRLLNLKAFS